MAELIYHDPGFVRFYDTDNDARTDLEAIARLAQGARTVLDIGCGTGFLARLLPPGTRYTGADPAAAMLDIARAAPVQAQADWVQSEAAALDLGQRFDLIVMSGHAFQCFLTAETRRAALAAVARHLHPQGRFVFDSRNPACREWEEWTPAASIRQFDLAGIGLVEAWNDVAYDPVTAIATYGTTYVTADATQSATAQIAFPDITEITAALADNGLQASLWWGDWDGRPYGPRTPEIIPIGGFAR